MWTTCAATTRTTSARLCSRHSHARCGCRCNSIRQPARRYPARREAFEAGGDFSCPAGVIRSKELELTIAVVDYGMGNLLSVAKAIERVAPGAQVEITSSPQQVD